MPSGSASQRGPGGGSDQGPARSHGPSSSNQPSFPRKGNWCRSPTSAPPSTPVLVSPRSPQLFPSPGGVFKNMFPVPVSQSPFAGPIGGEIRFFGPRPPGGFTDRQGRIYFRDHNVFLDSPGPSALPPPPFHPPPSPLRGGGPALAQLQSQGFTPSQPPNQPSGSGVSGTEESPGASDPQSSSSSLSQNPQPKQKTPMSQIAELARYNKLCHNYKLINESGPAHQKNFVVNLILKEGEEYRGEGASIRKAQQAAAKEALAVTKLPRPHYFSSTRSLNHSTSSSQEQPTVALTGVAHKLGLYPKYEFLPPSGQPFLRPPFHNPASPLLQLCNGQVGVPHFLLPHQLPPPLRHPRRPLQTVSLTLGGQDFLGTGFTKQDARNDAALQALHAFDPETARKILEGPEGTINGFARWISPSGNTGVIQLDSVVPGNGAPDRRKEGSDRGSPEKSPSAEAIKKQLENKSPISLVHEIALQKKMEVKFEVLSEEGPPHERVFGVLCTLTNRQQVITSKGTGGSKKDAKHKACNCMIEKLIESGGHLPLPGSLPTRRPKLPKSAKRKTIIKDVKMDPDYGQQINPISRLIQIQQGKQESEPVFSFVSELGEARRKEFTMEVTVGERKAQGTGPNKKLAKRAAAEVMLEMLGYAKPLPKPGKSVLKQSSLGSSQEKDGENTTPSDRSCSPEEEEEEKPEQSKANNTDSGGDGSEKGTGTGVNGRKVTFDLEKIRTRNCNNEDAYESPQSLTRSNLPGILYITGSKRLKNPVTVNADIAALAKELLNAMILPMGVPKVDSLASVPPPPSPITQLQSLASRSGFHIQFTDFPSTTKDDGSSEHLSLVSLGIAPPSVCHGAGKTQELARSEAAFSALKLLSEWTPALGKLQESQRDGRLSLSKKARRGHLNRAHLTLPVEDESSEQLNSGGPHDYSIDTPKHDYTVSAWDPTEPSVQGGLPDSQPATQNGPQNSNSQSDSFNFDQSQPGGACFSSNTVTVESDIAQPGINVKSGTVTPMPSIKSDIETN